VIARGLHPDWRAMEFEPAEWRWPSFTPAELACKCAGRSCKGQYWHDPSFLTRLQALRDHMGRPLRVNSGRRCRLHNARVGGAPLSQHKLSIGVDISVAGWTRGERKKLLLAVIALGFGGVGYASSFLHLDARPMRPSGIPAQWDYSKGGMAQWRSLLN